MTEPFVATWRQLRVLAALLAIVLAVAACNGPESVDEAEAEAPDPDEEMPAEPDPDAPPPAEFIYAAAGVPDHLDSWTAYGGDPHRNLHYEQSSRLLRYDARGLAGDGCEELPATEHLRPELAESWERDEEGNLIFNLRQGVLSPAGNEMTAEDVKWSFDRHIELGAVVQFLMFTVVAFAEENTVEIIDDYTVRFNVSEPTALDFAVFTWNQMQVFDTAEILPHVTDEDPLAAEWFESNWAGFGPWQLERFDAGNEVVLTANPNFWGQDERGNIDRLVIRNVAESSTRMTLLQAGEADFAERLSFDEYASLQGQPGVQVLDCVSPNRDTILLNQADERFVDVRVRDAISLAIDRETLAAGPYRGLATPSTTGLAEIYWSPPADAARFEYNPDRARELLAEAGAEGLSFEITASPTRPGGHAESVAIQIQSMLADVGVNVSINVVPGASEFSDAFFEGNYEGMIYLEPPALGDAFYSLNLYNTSVSFQNTFDYANDHYDDLTFQIRDQEPGPERDELIAEASDLIVAEQPQIYLVERSYVHAFAEGISGYHNTSHGAVLTFQLTKS